MAYAYHEAYANPQEYQYHQEPVHRFIRGRPRTVDNRPHAPRRVQHGYSSERGAYIHDVGAYREDGHHQVPGSRSYHYFTEEGPRYEQPSRRDADYRNETSSNSRRSEVKRDSPKSKPSSSSTTSGSSKKSSRSSASRSSTLLTPPDTPEIGRLSTPELAPLSAGLRFCSCGCSDANHDDEERYLKRRAGMDANLQNAMAYIASHNHEKSIVRRRD